MRAFPAEHFLQSSLYCSANIQQFTGNLQGFLDALNCYTVLL